MDRRNFLLGVLGAAGAAAGMSRLTTQAEAAPLLDRPLLDQLKDMDAGKAANPLADTADLPAEGAQETQYYYRRRAYRVYRRPVYVYRRPVRCRWYRNVWGVMVRSCF